jgi:hypothetical protein
MDWKRAATLIAAFTIGASVAGDFSLVDMAKQNRAREEAWEAREQAEREAKGPSDQKKTYTYKRRKTQADYDRERRENREREVDRSIEEAEAMIRNSDRRMAEIEEQADRAQCQRWLGATENMPVGSKALAILKKLGNPTTTNKYRAAGGEVEEWVYYNPHCSVRFDLVGYRVLNVYTSN